MGTDKSQNDGRISQTGKWNISRDEKIGKKKKK